MTHLEPYWWLIRLDIEDVLMNEYYKIRRYEVNNDSSRRVNTLLSYLLESALSSQFAFIYGKVPQRSKLQACHRHMNVQSCNSRWTHDRMLLSGMLYIRQLRFKWIFYNGGHKAVFEHYTAKLVKEITLLPRCVNSWWDKPDIRWL